MQSGVTIKPPARNDKKERRDIMARKRVRLNKEPGPTGDSRDKPATSVAPISWTVRNVRDWAYRTGEVPHIFLLRIARGEEIDGYQPTFQDRVDAAKNCAGYFAPKLQAVHISEKDPGVKAQEISFNADALSELDDAELAIFEKVFGKLVGRGNAGSGKDPKVIESSEIEYKRTIDN